MNFQYVHYRRRDFLDRLQPTGGKTYFLDTPTQSQLLQLFHDKTPTIKLGFGQIECHVRDNYCKAIGRRYALERARTFEFTLTEIRISGDSQKFFLQTNEGTPRTIFLEGHPDSDKLFFRGAN